MGGCEAAQEPGREGRCNEHQALVELLKREKAELHAQLEAGNQKEQRERDDAEARKTRTLEDENRTLKEENKSLTDEVAVLTSRLNSQSKENTDALLKLISSGRDVDSNGVDEQPSKLLPHDVGDLTRGAGGPSVSRDSGFGSLLESILGSR